MPTVTLPASLYAEMERAAATQKRSVDDVAKDAVERYVTMSRREKLRSYGEERARKLNLREDLVTKYVHEIRKTER